MTNDILDLCDRRSLKKKRKEVALKMQTTFKSAKSEQEKNEEANDNVITDQCQEIVC